mgnify:CR=1 FL=1
MDRTRFRKLGFSDLHPLKKVQADFLDLVNIKGDIELVHPRDAFHRYLAKTVTVKLPVPPYDKSAMDGYAIQARDSFGANVRNPKIVRLVDAIAIEEKRDLKVQQGTAIKVATGAMVPEGADAVIKIEDTEFEKERNQLKLYNPVVPGKNIMKQGEDYRQGDTLLDRGRSQLPQDVGALVTVGYRRVPVIANPKVTIIATGNELIDIDEVDDDGSEIELDKVYDGGMVNSNQFAIGSFVRLAGGEVIDAFTIKDDEQTIKGVFNQSLINSDMVITTGGTSVGEKDLMPVVMDSDHEILYHGIAVRPGSATLVGFGIEKPVVCLSGFPVAAEIGMLYLAMPAIRKMAGARLLDPRVLLPARISTAVPKKGFGITRMLRVKLDYDQIDENGLPAAHSVKLSGSSMQRSMIESDGFVEIPPESEGLEKGDIVKVRLHYN